MSAQVTPIASAFRFSRGDHVELAQRLRQDLGGPDDVVFADGQIYQYQGTHFAPVEVATARQMAQRYAGAQVKRSEGKTATLKLKNADIRGVVATMQDAAYAPRYFDDAVPGLAFRDCFVTVSSHRIQLQRHSRKHKARFAYDFDYQPEAHPAQLVAFFASVFRDDPDAADKIRCLQEFMGACMLGIATRFQQAIFQLGDGSNGKSVLAAVLPHIMPPGSTSSVPTQQFGQEYRRAKLAGKLLNVVSELPKNDILDAESFKAIVAGDQIDARHIYAEPFDFAPRAGHLYSANSLPGTSDQTFGFWRRVIILRYNRIFPEHEQDRDLPRKLIAERAKIACWALAGAQRVLKSGHYTMPSSAKAALDEWRQNSDQVALFLEEETHRLGPSERITDGASARDLYKAYADWAKENGHRPLSSTSFGERMRLLGVEKQHTNQGKRYALRIRVRSPWAQD